MLDISALLEEIKASPYVESVICAPHCGVLSFNPELKPGRALAGPGGQWKEEPGELLASLERERNTRPIYALERGELVYFNQELAGCFVEAGTELARIRRRLSREEALRGILQKVLYLFNAPEKAKYYFIPQIDLKVKNTGPQSVTVRNGMELFIISRMKRETPLPYSGPDGVIYAVYFDFKRSVEAGAPLIGVCPPDMVERIAEAGIRVQTEWPEA